MQTCLPCELPFCQVAQFTLVWAIEAKEDGKGGGSGAFANFVVPALLFALTQL